MLKSFFLFWPANVMPFWLLISLLQLFIPFNLLLRSCCIEDTRHFRIHWVSGLLIVIGCIVNMCTIGALVNAEDSGQSGQWVFSSFMVMLSSVLDAISHTIKEALVRT